MMEAMLKNILANLEGNLDLLSKAQMRHKLEVVRWLLRGYLAKLPAGEEVTWQKLP